jgi:RNA polymerase-associated protein CTR9
VTANSGQDILTGEKSKEGYYKDSAQFLNAGEKAAYEGGERSGGTLAFLTRGTPNHVICRATYSESKLTLIGIQQLATRSMDDALRSFEGVLAEKPTNIVALLGKVCKLWVLSELYPILTAFQARILYARRQFSQALKLFQQVLQYSPRCIPDPRIGIGLCLWAMDHKAKAKAAWQRSLEVVCPGVTFFIALVTRILP